MKDKSSHLWMMIVLDSMKTHKIRKKTTNMQIRTPPPSLYEYLLEIRKAFKMRALKLESFSMCLEQYTPLEKHLSIQVKK